MNQNNPNFNNTGYNDYTQNNFNSNNDHAQQPTMEQYGYSNYLFNNGASASYTTDNNYGQQPEQQLEQSMFSFTNNETQPSLSMSQHQDINQNPPSLPLNSMIADSSQANNSESVFNLEIPGFKIKIIITPTSSPFANLNQFQHTYSNSFANNPDNSQTQFQQFQ